MVNKLTLTAFSDLLELYPVRGIELLRQEIRKGDYPEIMNDDILISSLRSMVDMVRFVKGNKELDGAYENFLMISDNRKKEILYEIIDIAPKVIETHLPLRNLKECVLAFQSTKDLDNRIMKRIPRDVIDMDICRAYVKYAKNPKLVLIPARFQEEELVLKIIDKERLSLHGNILLIDNPSVEMCAIAFHRCFLNWNWMNGEREAEWEKVYKLIVGEDLEN
jgi:hypothetical protein